MEPELEVLLSGPVVDDGVDERHEGRLDVDVVAVLPRAPVKVVYYALHISGFTLSMLMTRFSNSSFWQKILTLVSMLMSTVSMVYQNLPI